MLARPTNNITATCFLLFFTKIHSRFTERKRTFQKFPSTAIDTGHLFSYNSSKNQQKTHSHFRFLWKTLKDLKFRWHKVKCKNKHKKNWISYFISCAKLSYSIERERKKTNIRKQSIHYYYCPRMRYFDEEIYVQENKMEPKTHLLL